MKKIILIGTILLSVNSFSQKVSKYTTAVIQTSAQCADCEERIENGLNNTKGIKFAEMDMNSMKVTVKFKTKLIEVIKIKEKISSIGYSADEVPADPKAFEELPTCCKPGGMKAN